MKVVLAFYDKQVLPDGAILEMKIWQLAKADVRRLRGES
jgi:hypothetical protein